MQSCLDALLSEYSLGTNPLQLALRPRARSRLASFRADRRLLDREPSGFEAERAVAARNSKTRPNPKQIWRDAGKFTNDLPFRSLFRAGLCAHPVNVLA